MITIAPRIGLRLAETVSAKTGHMIESRILRPSNLGTMREQ